MAKVVAALYDDVTDALEAIHDLERNGFGSKSINVLSNNVSAQQPAEVGEKESDVLLKGSTVGSVAGGLAGAMAGLAALAIPGIGPVLAAGPLFMAFFGATAGSVAGGFIGAFADWEIRDAEAEFYAEGVRRGGTLVTVQAESEEAALATEILNRHHSVNMKERTARWRASGWTRFDPKAKTFTVDEIARERALYSRTAAPEAGIGAVAEGTETPLKPGKPGILSFEDQDAAFRDHYRSTYARTGHDYSYYLPAYRFGYNLANDDRYASKEWATIEPELRRFWQDFDSGPWDEFEGAIRFARDAAKGRRE
jgi:hypothetical protein